MKSFAVVLLLLVIPMSAASQTISPQQLQELIAIFNSYTTITERLSDSLSSSETRIVALETGFAEYRQTVETVLIPQAKHLERQVLILEIALGVVAAVGCGLVVWMAVR